MARDDAFAEKHPEREERNDGLSPMPIRGPMPPVPPFFFDGQGVFPATVMG